MLMMMPQEGIVGIRIVIQSRTGANWTRKGAETDGGGGGVLELTGRRLRDYSAVLGRLEFGQGNLGVVPVEVVAAPGVSVRDHSHLVHCKTFWDF